VSSAMRASGLASVLDIAGRISEKRDGIEERFLDCEPRKPRGSPLGMTVADVLHVSSID